MPFMVAGYPNFHKSLKILKSLIKEADFLELGFPYSDPLADGPVIQRASSQALGSGMNTDLVFKLVKNIRRFSDIPITALVYANLIYRRGIGKFYRDAKVSGIDSVLVPDLPLEEAKPFISAARRHGIFHIFMITQTTTDRRIREISKLAKGFLYLVTVLGVTGEKPNIPREAIELIYRAKTQTKLPLCAGFGISTNNQVQILKKSGIEGIIVGSAIITRIEKLLKSKKDTYSQLQNFMKSSMN